MELPESHDLDPEKRESISSPLPSENEEKEETQPQNVGSSAQHEYLTGAKLYVVVASVTIVTFLMLIDIVIIVTAIPKITDHFHSLPDVGWYGAAYTITNAALQPLTGKLYTYFRLKWVYLTCFTIFEIGSLICGLATSSKMLIIGRAIAGMGTSGLQNGGITLLIASLPMDKRAAYQGFMMGTAQLGLVLGPVLGGVFTEYVSWRWCFYINLPVGGFAAAFLLYFNLPDQIPKAPFTTTIRTIWPKIDLPGFVLFASASTMFLLALEFGGVSHPWNSSVVIGLFVGGGVTYILFIFWEKRVGDSAMIPLSMISRRIIWCSCLFMASVMGCTFMASYYLPIFFQTVKGRSPVTSGVDLLPNICVNIAFAICTGVTISKVGYYLPFAVVSGCFLATAGGLFSTLRPSTSLARQVGFQVLLGAGQGTGVQIPLLATQRAVPPHLIAVAMSVVMWAQTFAGSIALSAANTILSNTLKTKIPHYAPSVDVHAVIEAGATGVRKVVHGADLVAVLRAYADSIDRVYYLSVAMGCVAFLCAWGLGWKDMRKKPVAPAKVEVSAVEGKGGEV